MHIVALAWGICFEWFVFFKKNNATLKKHLSYVNEWKNRPFPKSVFRPWQSWQNIPSCKGCQNSRRTLRGQYRGKFQRKSILKTKRKREIICSCRKIQVMLGKRGDDEPSEAETEELVCIRGKQKVAIFFHFFFRFRLLTWRTKARRPR